MALVHYNTTENMPATNIDKSKVLNASKTGHLLVNNILPAESVCLQDIQPSFH